MCGQAGIIFGKEWRIGSELDRLRGIFTRLLVLNEFRGRHATGIALINNEGDYRLLKRPVKATRFIRLPEYADLTGSLSGNVTLLMGHARHATVGSVEQTSNAHPIKSGCCLATANGTIFNADELFRKFRLSRFAEVDSELIARLADRHASTGEIKVKAFLRSLKSCRGQISAVVTSLLDPERVIVLKGNKPLTLWYNPKFKVIAYASDVFHLDVAIRHRKRDWIELDLPSMTCAVFDTTRLPEMELHPFKFTKQSWRQELCAK